MSENFDGALHDVDAEERPESEGSEEGEEDEPDLDKQMGEVDGQDTEKLDEKMWGDSEDEENEEVNSFQAKVFFFSHLGGTVGFF